MAGPHVGGDHPGILTMREPQTGTPKRRRGAQEKVEPLGDLCRNTPRRRGARRHGTGRNRLQRNTPASAGRTRPWPGCSRPATEHPRVGGEHDVGDHGLLNVRGTPPRRRGGRGQRPGLVVGLRNTPASAGRTSPTPSTSSGTPEHPRVGGEDRQRRSVDILATGTPPRRRGGRRAHGFPRHEQRNTSASAGRTSTRTSARSASSEHPRVGGEDASIRMKASTTAGTPPRRRGG